MPDVPHQHIQMGTGTFNPVLAIEGGYGWDRWRVSAFGFTQQVVYTNDKGYKAGDRYAAGVALRRALGRWSVRGGIEMQSETFEAWNGVRYTDEGNQGRIDAMFAAGTTWAATPELSVDLGLKVPFLNRVNDGQLRMPALLELGVSYAFGKRAARAADDHDHEHEHEDEHEHEGEHEHGGHADAGHDVHTLDTTGADVADIGHAGSRVELIPVPGKITIFDFWAEWCVPCKTLEPALVELAKANPEGVALRRIDVVDWESQVVAQYLTPRAFDLPHVKIYDANGKLVFEESSGPGKLQPMIATIRKLVGGRGSPANEAAPATNVSIVVTERGFEPADITVPHGVPVTLRFERKVKKTCATEINFKNGDDKVRHELPLDKPIEFTVTFKAAGTINYACDMDMIGGSINVR
jgi:thiol-disulfide isomerase/thioredoxin